MDDDDDSSPPPNAYCRAEEANSHSVENEAFLCQRVTEEDNSFNLRFLSEIPDEMENDDEKDDDDDDTDTRQYLSTSIQESRQWETRSGMLRHPTSVGEHFCTPFKQRGIQLIDK
ncbi:hypothetical protein AVEN_147464-1 [Araneus ventricosus]|uniref:Uncharacterized protein n=1 Tax=Araneus ventricosus TaxID=182803 RepID=A0A4Y2WB51_ARAVE|nr:hypothetical protein AVEN_107905-1 [Araneus ventricosus]GBO34400.1 hypothetical protein AVEN_147464-1 [Araneus ventricosus]